jgi:hypothetical protein
MKEARSLAMKLDNPMFKQKNKDAKAISVTIEMD